MTRDQLLSEIDAATEARLAIWQPVQEQYRQQNGRYMQVLCSHSEIPADGVATVPDRLANTPTDQQASLAALGFPADPLTAAIQVDAADGPEGQGWTLRLSVMWQGALWTRSIGFGSHSHTQPWREVSDEPA